MLIYNTQLKKMILPEYGRNIQQMVEHCLQIDDREQRTKCAYTIVATMEVMFPEMRSEANFEQKLWDHLAIMSDFKLDIDYPFPVIQVDSLDSKPQPIGYQLKKIKFRHYGKTIERMIARAADYPEGEEREMLIMLLANHMKKLICQISNEDVEDSKIFNDLYHYSDGRIRLNPQTHRLHEYQVIQQPQATGKKKKKK